MYSPSASTFDSDCSFLSMRAVQINVWGSNATEWVHAMVDSGHGHGAFFASCSYHCGGWNNVTSLAVILSSLETPC